MARDWPTFTSTQVLLCRQRSRCLLMSFTLAVHNFPLQFQLLARLPSSFQESKALSTPREIWGLILYKSNVGPYNSNRLMWCSFIISFWVQHCTRNPSSTGFMHEFRHTSGTDILSGVMAYIPGWWHIYWGDNIYTGGDDIIIQGWWHNYTRVMTYIVDILWTPTPVSLVKVLTVLQCTPCRFLFF